MREYDKMIRGELYTPADKELTEMRKGVRRLFYQYNQSEEDEQQRRRDLLDAMLGSHGQRFYFERPSVSTTAKIFISEKISIPTST